MRRKAALPKNLRIQNPNRVVATDIRTPLLRRFGVSGSDQRGLTSLSFCTSWASHNAHESDYQTALGLCKLFLTFLASPATADSPRALSASRRLSENNIGFKGLQATAHEISQAAHILTTRETPAGFGALLLSQ